MSDVNHAVTLIEATAKRLGLAELSRQSGIPYTTLIDMRRKGWRPKTIQIFERLLTLSDGSSADSNSDPTQDAAA